MQGFYVQRISANRALNHESMSFFFVVARQSFAGTDPLAVTEVAPDIAKNFLVFRPLGINWPHVALLYTHIFEKFPGNTPAVL